MPLGLSKKPFPKGAPDMVDPVCRDLETIFRDTGTSRQIITDRAEKSKESFGVSGARNCANPPTSLSKTVITEYFA